MNDTIDARTEQSDATSETVDWDETTPDPTEEEIHLPEPDWASEAEEPDPDDDCRYEEDWGSEEEEPDIAEPDPDDRPEDEAMWAWRHRARELAAWAARMLVCRRDRWGQYLPLRFRSGDGKRKAVTMPCDADCGTVVLSEELLIAHFRGEHEGDLIGLHPIAADNTCRYCAFDIDNHVENADKSVIQTNTRNAIALYEKLVEIGLRPLLTDSNGNGGYHIHVFFTEPVPSEVVFDFTKHIVAEMRGVKMESFPKQRRLQDGKLGNFLRLFGRHHTRAHFTEVYDGKWWRDGYDAIDQILAMKGDDPQIIMGFLARRTEQTTVEDARSSVNQTVEGSRVRSILAEIPASRFDDYDDWLRIGLAVHHEMPNDDGLALWDEFSKRSARYEAGACASRWDGFDDECEKPVTVGTLIAWIREEKPDYSPPRQSSQPATQTATGSPIIEALTLRERRQKNPNPQHGPVVIDGLLRSGEVMNIVGAPKMGKSFLAMLLAIAVAAGTQWLGCQTRRGKVLLIDGELDDSTIDTRLGAMVTAMGVDIRSIEDQMTVVSLRGTRTDISGIENFCSSIAKDEYALILLDPFYLLFPSRASEANDHDVRDLYLRIIRIAKRTNAAIAVVHHATKGNQAGKNVTDVGSGHGVISRIVNTHLTLLPAESNADALVRVRMEAVTRTFLRPPPKLLERASDDMLNWRVVEGVVEDGGGSSEGADIEAAMQFASICARPGCCRRPADRHRSHGLTASAAPPSGHLLPRVLGG
jgi:hypothetical protein